MGMNTEYSEADDFREHKLHIDDMYATLGSINIPKEARVLDVGGGQGMHACFLARSYALCYCLDIIDYQSLYNGEFYRLFKEKCARNSVVYNNQQLKFIENDAMTLLFRDGYFDFVTSFNALEHIPDPLKALDEMVRVTNKGGIIYVTFDPIWTADTGSHFIYRVPEPWAHLVDDQDTFVKKMQHAGSSEDEISDFKNGMNQLRLSKYREIFDHIINRIDIELLHKSSWSGFSQSSYKKHSNFKRCLQLGYVKEELKIRGMKYVFRKVSP